MFIFKNREWKNPAIFLKGRFLRLASEKIGFSASENASKSI